MAPKAKDNESPKEALGGGSSPPPVEEVPDREVGTSGAPGLVPPFAGEVGLATGPPASNTSPAVAEIDRQIAESIATTKKLRMLRTATIAFERRRAEIEALSGAK